VFESDTLTQYLSDVCDPVRNLTVKHPFYGATRRQAPMVPPFSAPGSLLLKAGRSDGKVSGIGMSDTPLFQLTRVHGLPMILLRGDLDCYHAPLVKERLFKLIENGDSDLILNLNGVDFVDSSGLAVIVAVHQRTLAHGGILRILCANRAIWHVFEITGLQRVFPVFREELALITSLDAK
jgi:anti-sigma B factor antagonist